MIHDPQERFKGRLLKISSNRTLEPRVQDHECVPVLHRLVKQTDLFMSEWQAGYRSQRGCRGNILRLAVSNLRQLHQQQKCVVTYIDFEAVFDSVEHKYLCL